MSGAISLPAAQQILKSAPLVIANHRCFHGSDGSSGSTALVTFWSSEVKGHSGGDTAVVPHLLNLPQNKSRLKSRST